MNKLIESLHKPIIQYSKEGIELKQFESLREAALELNIWDGTICNALKGKTKTSGGYIWKYKQLQNS